MHSAAEQPGNSSRYLYWRLSEKEFQQLCGALLRLRSDTAHCLPVGMADKGRDIVDGAVVYQVKWTRNTVQNPDRWLVRAIRREWEKIQVLVQEHSIARYVLMTSVAATTASYDRLQARLEEFSRALGVRIECLWQADIDAEVDAAPDALKLSYPEMLAGFDLIRAVDRHEKITWPVDAAQTTHAQYVEDAAEALDDLMLAVRAAQERDWGTAKDHAVKAAEMAKASGDWSQHFHAMLLVAQALFAGGQFAAAAEIAEVLAESKAAVTRPTALAQSLTLASVANRAEDRVFRAVVLGARAEVASTTAPPSIRAEALMALVSALVEAGCSPEEVRPHLVDLAAQIPRLKSEHSQGMIAWTLGITAFVAEDTVEGRARCEQARRLLDPRRDIRLWLRFHSMYASRLVRAGIADGVDELLRVSLVGLEIFGNTYDIVEARQIEALFSILKGEPESAASMMQMVLADPVLGRIAREETERILSAARHHRSQNSRPGTD